MFAGAFDAGGEPQQFGVHGDDLPLAFGQRARLVDDQRINVFHTFERFGILDEDAHVSDGLAADHFQTSSGKPDAWMGTIRARIDGWGGPPTEGPEIVPGPIVSSYRLCQAIEEQRVRVTIDFSDLVRGRGPRVGHDYRVVVHVTTWSARTP